MMMKVKEDMSHFIRWSTVLLLISNGWYHFLSEQSYGYLFNQNSTEITTFFGITLIFFGILAAFWRKQETKLIYLFLIPSLILFINTLGSFIKANYVFEQIIEHFSQFGLPVLFIFAFSKTIKYRNLIQWTMIIISLTFIGHGLFAIGLHYQPGNFINMTMAILNTNTIESNTFLIIMGLLDFIVAIGIFFKATRKVSLIYMIIWGLLTALARTVFVHNETSDIIIHYIPQTLFRLPNSILPLMILLYYRLEKTKI
jgi:hypothetical protein